MHLTRGLDYHLVVGRGVLAVDIGGIEGLAIGIEGGTLDAALGEWQAILNRLLITHGLEADG